MPSLPTNFNNDIQGSDLNLFPIVVIGNWPSDTANPDGVGWGEGNWSTWIKNCIVLSTNEFSFVAPLGDGNTVHCLPLLSNVPSLKESIDIEKRHYKISHVTLQLSNFPYNSTRLSGVIASPSTDATNNRILNTSLSNVECRIFWWSPSTTWLEPIDITSNLELNPSYTGEPPVSSALQIYYGNIRKYTHSDEKVTLNIEDRSQSKLHKYLPLEKHYLTEDNAPEKYINKPIPMVYGHVDRSPVALSMSEERGEYYVLPDTDASGCYIEETGYPDDTYEVNHSQYGVFLEMYRDEKYVSVIRDAGNSEQFPHIGGVNNPLERYGYAEGLQYHVEADRRSLTIFNKRDPFVSPADSNDDAIEGINPIGDDKAFVVFITEPIIKLYQEADDYQWHNWWGFLIRTVNVHHYPTTIGIWTDLRWENPGGGEYSDNNNLTGQVADAWEYAEQYIFPSPPVVSEYLIKSYMYGTFSLTNFSDNYGANNHVEHPSFAYANCGFFNSRGFAYPIYNYNYHIDPNGEQLPSTAVMTWGLGEGYQNTDHYTHVQEWIESPELSFKINVRLVTDQLHQNVANTTTVKTKLDITHWYQETYFLIDKFIGSDFFVNVRGRLGETPTMPKIINDIMTNELGHAVIDDPEYNTWAYAFTIDKKINSKKLIEGLAASSPYIPRFDNMGNFKFDIIKDSYDGVGLEDQKIKEVDVIDFSFSRTPIEDVYMRVILKWNWNYGKEEFDNSHTASLTHPFGDGTYDPGYYGFSGTPGYPSDDWGYGEAELVIDDDRGKYIRKSSTDTAIRFAAWYLNWHANQHLKMKVRLPLAYLNLEIGKIVAFDALLGGLKPYGIRYTFNDIVNGQDVFPYFMILSTNKTLEFIEIECIQMHNLSFGAATTWGCTDPEACNYDAGSPPEMDDGTCITAFDLHGINADCDGCLPGYELDNCGDCNQPDSGDWDGCCGHTIDCAGVCNGDAYLDNCSNCVGGTTGLEACVQDCAGTWGGDVAISGCDDVCGSTAELDICGVCGGGGIPDGDCDCDGNIFDECGVCGGDAINWADCCPEGSVPLWNETCYSIIDTTELDLSGQSLNTEILPAIGLLENLTYLDLRGCELYGEIPEELGHLSNLTHLYLSDNSLALAVPDSFTDQSAEKYLSSLRFLRIANNNITSLPSQIGILTTLETISASGNYLTSIPSSITSLENLEELRLNDNAITELPVNINSLDKLEKLYVQGNELTALPANIYALGNLRILYANDNFITDIITNIGGLTSLEELRLNDNEIMIVPDSICDIYNNTLLPHEFKVENNHICDENYIPSCLSGEDIGLQDCADYDYGCPADPGDLNNDGILNILDIVKLANCVIAEEGDVDCPDLQYGCAADINGDGIYNVLDIVALVNMVLAE